MQRSGFYHSPASNTVTAVQTTSTHPATIPDLQELTKNKWLMIGALGAGFLLLKSGKGFLGFGAGIAAGYYGRKFITTIDEQ
jgi:hypothetical protein